ncbi:hypothetical protein ADIARSV_0710 [Arcticibacter svalbardensis MN12-7]|uniref:Histidine kinase/HSP90-like ATPase domain-containing protein n=1 Tax=Arcticibacter svalbardensis MN12-7 TaxID=1150600 RepID=R9GWD9_9SPHI|nr:sensor histidine kinase [Arcticibacter svalbardensis]EOR96066.1 hypothetical protein ADIARSV_0710 [Arcticibacter svalbardensis MN12-7]
MSIKKTFHFNNKSAEIFPLMNEIVSYIKDYVPALSNIERLIPYQHVLVELLTNAVKHAGADSSLFSIEITEKEVTIIKTDNGNSFYLNKCGSFPLHVSFEGQQVEIRKDALYCLYGIIHSAHSLVFKVVEYPLYFKEEVTSLYEHYGLLILIKSSNHVSYRIDPETGLNHFIVTIII